MKKAIQSFKAQITFYRKVLADPRTPRVSRWLLGVAIAYVLMPFDLIPDWIPVLGQIDDLILVPILVYLAIRFIPKEVLATHRTAEMES